MQISQSKRQVQATLFIIYEYVPSPIKAIASILQKVFANYSTYFGI